MSANFHPLIYFIDYLLGIIMWTLIGRVAMNIFQKEDSQFFFMRVFVKYTNPLIKLFKPKVIQYMETMSDANQFSKHHQLVYTQKYIQL